MMQSPKEALQDLIQTYGPEQVKAAADILLQSAGRQIPAEYVPVIHPKQLSDTFEQLNMSVSDILEAGRLRSEASGGKADLLRRKTQLEAAIQLTESEAIMKIRGEGKEAHAIVNGEKVSLTNETARDAYRRNASAEERRQLAEVEAQLAALEVAAMQANDRWFATKDACESVRAKASLQAATLNFLAGR